MATDYYTAYRGIANRVDGTFDHFIRRLDPFHIQHGYWRFHSIDDDRRAMASGFTTPEAVLTAVEENDASSDQLNRIAICWVRGVNDPHSEKALSASALGHLQTIYELRDLLGLPKSSRGRISLHPVSDDVRLKQYWQEKFGAPVSGFAQYQPGAGTVYGSNQGITDRAPFQEKPSAVSPAKVFDTPQYTTPEAGTVQSEDATLASSPNVPPRRSTPTPSGRVETEEASPETLSESIWAGGSPQIASASQCDDLKDPSQLPCMDCGEEDGHKYDCNIGNLMPMMDPTVLDYRDWIDAGNQFDSGPYTTHFDQHPEPEPEDPQTQIAGMAAVIRNEDSYKEDAELHRLPDELMILLWAFKTSGDVCVISVNEWA